MYCVAICDDDRVICDQIEEYLEHYCHSGVIEIQKYYTVEELYTAINGGTHFNLIFLDILFGAPKGIDIGRRIREEMQNEKTHLVFISGREDFAMQLFETRPLDFLIKPIRKEQVVKSLEKSMELTELYYQYFEFKSENAVYRLLYRDVIYFESKSRKVIIHTEEKDYEFYGRLDDIQKTMQNKFYRIHKSYLINPLYTEQFVYDKVKLRNGEILPISKTYRSNTRKLLKENWRKL